MNILVQHWSFDPFLVVAGLLALFEERGLRRLGSRSSPQLPSARQRARARRRKAWFFYAGLAVLVVAVASPVDYWSSDYLFVHMVQHLLLLFAAPVLVVVGAPLVPLQHGLPVGVRRPIARFFARGWFASVLRALGRPLGRPWSGTFVLVTVLVVWHLPVMFDMSERDQVVHVLGMHTSFFAAGVLFFVQMLGSRPFPALLSPGQQMAAVFATACSFWLLAMAMGLFSKGAWYPWYRVHEGPGLSPFADQQIAAGIMWTCGGFWAIPAMVRAIRKLMETGGQADAHARLSALAQGERAHFPGRAHMLWALQADEIERAAVRRLGNRGPLTAVQGRSASSGALESQKEQP